jgi:hypothetical protein
MAIKTNLFQGDRVKLSKMGVREGMSQKTIDRIGTIWNNTLHPKAECLRVHWDGNAGPGNKDYYEPDELVLYEEEEVA